MQRPVNDASIDVFVDAGTPSDPEEDDNDGGNDGAGKRKDGDRRRVINADDYRPVNGDEATGGGGGAAAAAAGGAEIDADRLQLGLTRRFRYSSVYAPSSSASTPTSGLAAPISGYASASAPGSAYASPRASSTFPRAPPPPPSFGVSYTMPPCYGAGGGGGGGEEDGMVFTFNERDRLKLRGRPILMCSVDGFAIFFQIFVVRTESITTPRFLPIESAHLKTNCPTLEMVLSFS